MCVCVYKCVFVYECGGGVGYLTNYSSNSIKDYYTILWFWGGGVDYLLVRYLPIHLWTIQADLLSRFCVCRVFFVVIKFCVTCFTDARTLFNE